MTKKYVVEITPAGCSEMFGEHGLISTNDRRLIETPEKVALVVFTGGHDVWPELYGQNVGRYTGYSIQRDMYEGKMFEIAQEHNIPCVGICRGSQFLCVKSGGKLAQHILGHAGYHHKIQTKCGKTMFCNSSHHQMQIPPESAEPLAWAEPRLSRYYLDGDNEEFEVDREYEVVYYPNINAIGIQGHPEWMSPEQEFVKYSQEIVRKYLFK